MANKRIDQHDTITPDGSEFLLIQDSTTLEYNKTTISSAVNATSYTKIEVDTSLAGKAEAIHVHAMSDVTGLQTALDGKVGKVTTVNTLYGVNGSGNQTSYLMSQAAATSSVAQRSSGGTLTVGTPTASAHATTKAYVDTALTASLSTKQDTLVSGTNIKTVNGSTLLGSGDIVIAGGGGTVDSVNAQTGVVVLDQDDIGDGTTYKQYSATEKTKLAGIATGATANGSDATLLNRANHTGTQAISTILSLQGTLDSKAPASHTHTLDNLSDVAITTPSTGQVLKYNGSGWVNDTDATSGGAGATNLSTTLSSTQTVIASDTGTDATIPAVDGTNAGVMTPTMKSKLDGIEASADVTDATNVAAAGAFMKSVDDMDDITDGTTYKKYSATEKTKLAGIATGANVGVVPNAAITGATKTKVTYDAKGLVTAGADATTADIADSSNKRYVTDAQLTVIGNTSGTNSGDVSVTGEDYLSLTGQAITANAINLDNLSASGTPSATTFLRGDNTWATPAGGGTGDVVGPVSSTDNAIARFDGTTGELLQSSPATIDDTGTIIIGATNDLYLSSNGSVVSYGSVSTAVFDTLRADNIIERNTGVGITVDGVLIKDGLVDGKDVSTLTANTGDVTLAGTQTLTNKTISGSSNTISDIVATTSLTATGTKSSATYLRGDNTWATPTNTTYSEITTAEIDAGTASTARTITGRRVDYIQDKTLERAYPVGSIYISTVSTNPNTLFGFGTWVAYGEGRVIVGKAASGTFATAGATGGAETHTLSETEMPSHTHIQNAHNHTQASHTHTLQKGSSAGGDGTGVAWSSTAGTNAAGVESVTPTINNTTATNQNTGGGGPHNNLQPYIVAYIWNRTA